MRTDIYKKNQRALILAPEIIFLFRKQFYFGASKRLCELTGLLNEIVADILKRQASENEKSEWMEILTGFVQAQENQDYILIADILEGDLIPMLQKFQIQIKKETSRLKTGYWEENLESIKAVDEELYQKIKSQETVSGKKYQLLEAITGEPVVRAVMPEKEFYLHSTVNPQWEGKLLAESVEEEQNHEYYVLGMGLGYHVRALLDKDIRNRVIVLEWDANMLYMALECFLWDSDIREGRLSIVYHEDIAVCMKQLKTGSALLVHCPSVQCVENVEIRELLEDYFMVTSSMYEQGNLLEENFIRLQDMKLPECSELRELFERKNCVLVGGGPSADEEMDAIKRYREKIVVIAVGTIVGKLMNNGIRPDVIVITDPQKHMYRQIQGLDTKGIPLILLSTASADIVPYYQGKVYLAYQKGYENAEKAAWENGYLLFETGGSVSTLAIDIAIRFCAQKIILVGMDMAYTGNHSHAAGIGRDITEQKGLRTIVSTEGKMIYTSRNLNVYRKWIEQRLADGQRPEVYNIEKERA